MSDILNQDEIDALLNAFSTGEVELPTEEVKAVRKGLNVYDFKRPERISKDQLRSLETIHEVFARNLGASLSTYLRTIIEVKFETADQLTYSEFLMSLPNPTCFSLLSCEPLEGNMILEINPSIIFPIIEKLEAASKITSTSIPDRPLTEIEWELIQNILSKAIQQLKTIWKNVKEIDFKIIATESNPHLMQIVPPNEPIVLLSFNIIMGEFSGTLNLCIPFMTIEPILSNITAQTWMVYTRRDKHQADKQTSIKDSIANCVVEVRCLVTEATISMADFKNLEKGDILETNKPANSPVLIFVEGKPKFWAFLGAFKRHFAAKILEPASSRANVLKYPE